MTARQKIALATLETIGYVTQVILNEAGELEVSWHYNYGCLPQNFIIDKKGEIR